MIQQYPSRLLEKAVSEFAKLPGVGRRTALRLVLYLLRRDKKDVLAFAESKSELVQNVKYCSVCHSISVEDL